MPVIALFNFSFSLFLLHLHLNKLIKMNSRVDGSVSASKLKSLTAIEDSQRAFPQYLEEVQELHPELFTKLVPIIKFTNTTTTAQLVKKRKGKGKDKVTQGKHDEIIARGKLVGRNNIDFDLSGEIDFKGNFEGGFEEEKLQQFPFVKYYFEGEITDLIIIKIKGEDPSNEKKEELHDLTYFKGYFYGILFPVSNLDEGLNLIHLSETPRDWNVKDKVMKTKKKIEYHVPTMVRLDIRKINEINLSKSSATIAGILHIDIQLNQQIFDLLYDKQKNRFKQKHTLTVDFHRGKPIELPFYQQYEEEEADSDDEWGDGAQGEALWNQNLMRMSYEIDMEFTAEIDNSHGIFYAPFNLNILRIIIDVHSVKIDKKTKICFNCCDLTDFNQDRTYTPYTFFQNLSRNSNYDIKDSNNHPKIYQKHIDRLNKIDTSNFRDQGEYKIANNRVSMFPYHHRVLMNRNTLTSDIRWTLGTASRTALLQKPIVRSISQGYRSSMKTAAAEVFDPKEWEFVHIQLPIYKYPVIDMIRIFVPILILSAISMTIFEQENGKDDTDITLLDKRIASGCNLMIAYIALIPMVSSGLPPTPSLTLVQILIYLSVIPNILAIISVFFNSNTNFKVFFAEYAPFFEGLFVASFVICCISFSLLIILMAAYVRKDYKSDYTIYKFEPSPMSNLRAPKFLQYIEAIKIKRGSDILIEQLKIPYDQYQEK